MQAVDSNQALPRGNADIAANQGAVYLLRISGQSHHSWSHFERIDLQRGKLWPGRHVLNRYTGLGISIKEY